MTPPTGPPVPPRLWEFPLFPPLRAPFLRGEPSARPNPAVLGVFVGSGLEKGAGGPRVVHSGGPVQGGFSWGATWEVVTLRPAARRRGSRSRGSWPWGKGYSGPSSLGPSKAEALPG